ncbi:MAG: hypothetical protein ACTH1D_04935 [Mycobacteriaceae bacterium]|uniref:hypothetical protein n=1 Tax=Corynebacterium sp. TaxID=1720 RepID=UPI003F9DEDBD
MSIRTPGTAPTGAPDLHYSRARFAQVNALRSLELAAVATSSQDATRNPAVTDRVADTTGE